MPVNQAQPPRASRDRSGGADGGGAWRFLTGCLPGQPVGNASEQVVNRQLVAAALGGLTREHREVLRECCFLGRSVAQAAHALGIEPGTVKSRTYYALRALRLAIEELRDVESR
jgi:RNA polymerase sigma-70 factor (ECF subfamily)